MGNSKTFIKITNQNIYDKLIAIEGKIDKQKTHIKVLYGAIAVIFVAIGLLLEIHLR